MKLVRYGSPGLERPGLLDADGRILDLSDHISDLAGASLGPDRLANLAAINPATLPLVDGAPRLGPCVGQVAKFICVGLNYHDHAKETNSPVPEEPILFHKATSAIVGPNDNIMLPDGALKADWEIELGVVIGSVARYVEQARALDYVAGYCIVNDVSERAFQIERGGQWTKGKSADTFGPIGPWLVTKDEIADPQALDMLLDINGVRRQTGNTKNMIFGVAHLVAYISRFMTLQPGDVISTGTPPGVGLGMKPPQFLAAGDMMRLCISGLGEQNQRVVSFRL